MNERIKQLWEQAAKTTQGDSWEEQTKFIERFAELIVKECVQVCSDRGANHDGVYSAWADDCSKRIGKHFGVEE